MYIYYAHIYIYGIHISNIKVTEARPGFENSFKPLTFLEV